MSQNTEVEVQFILPKKASILPREDPSKITKTIRLHVEDFLERLNDSFLPKEDFIKSPTFLIGGVTGFLGIYVTRKGKQGIVCLDASHGEVPLSLQNIGVTGVCGSLSIEESRAQGDDYLCVELGSIEVLEEAMISSGNHKLDLRVTLTMESKACESEWIIPSKKPRLSVETLVAKISQDVDFTDFSLESEDGAKFPCHRTVLAAQSSVLKRMFLSPMEEKKTSSLQLGYKAGIVGKFVKFFYGGKIGGEEEEENFRCFLDLSEKYDLPHLQEEVEELAIKKLTVENMVEMFLLADLYSAENLRTAAEGFVRTNRLKVKEGLAELDKLERSQLMKIVNICIV